MTLTTYHLIKSKKRHWLSVTTLEESPEYLARRFAAYDSEFLLPRVKGKKYENKD